MAESPASIITARSTAIIDNAIASVAATRTSLGFMDPEPGESYGIRSYQIRAIAERLIANNAMITWDGLAATSYILKIQILVHSSQSLAIIYETVEFCIDQNAMAVVTARTQLDNTIGYLHIEKAAAEALNNSGCLAASMALQNRAALVATSENDRAISELQAVTADNTAMLNTLHPNIADLRVLVDSGSIPQDPLGGNNGLLQVDATSLRFASHGLTERSIEFATERRMAEIENVPVKVARTHGRHFTAAFDHSLARFERDQNLLLLRIEARIAEIAENLNSAANLLEQSDTVTAGTLL